MSRRRRERRLEAEDRWPRLANMMGCYFHKDYRLLHGSVSGALAAVTVDTPLELRRALLAEWRDWNATAGAVDDVRPLLDDGFGVALQFQRAEEARTFMNCVYDALIISIRAETGKE